MPHLLKQRYLITDTLGRGGMGVVYKAHDTQLGNRLVAIKEMRQSSGDQNAVDAFKHEAEILAHLMHPHLPSIHEHFTESGYWYLVMEFIEGQTLEKYVQAQGGRLPYDEVIELGLQLCTILDYLHTRQPPIIFRDLKPLNIMISPDGHLYLIDFGIARHFTQGQTSDTAIGFSVGYAAPEQYPVVSTQTTPLSDIYGLGATLHRLLTGNNPSMNKPTPFNFPPPQLHEQATSTKLAALIMQMVELDAGNRPASIAHVKQRLLHITTQRPMSPEAWPEAPVVRILPSTGRHETSPLMGTPTAAPLSPSVTKRGISRRVLLTGLATLALAGSGVIGWSIIQHQPTSVPKPAATLKPTPAIKPTSAQIVLPPTLEIAFSTNATNKFLSTISSTDGVTWPTSTQAQGQIQLQASPALATFNNKRYMAFIGNEVNNILYVTTSDSQVWQGAKPTILQTQETPAMVVFNNMLYIAYTANNGTNLLYMSSSADGQNWSAATTPNAMHLQGSPTMAVFKQILYIAFRSSDTSNSLCIASSSDGQNWSGVTEYDISLRMQGSPTMAQFNNNLYIAFRSYDSDNSLYVTSSADGQNWPAATAFGQSLQGDPSMTVFNNMLYIAYQANDSSNALAVASSADGQNWSADRHFTIALQDSPSIAAL